MRALSLTQPWAQLVALGAKRIETRSWPTDYRGPLAIHAAKKMPREARHLFYCAPFAQTFADARDRHELPDGVFECDYETGWQGFAERLPRGAIVAVCDLVECLTRFDALRRLAARAASGDEAAAFLEPAFGNYDPGRFAFLLANVRALPDPVPCRGALGLWNVPAEIAALIDQKVAV